MEKPLVSAFLSLGSNLGNKIENLSQALNELNQRAGQIIQVSSVYETEPVGFQSDDKFLNLCAELHTALDPFELLKITSEIELHLGRKRDNSGNYSSRTLDIDIIIFDNVTMNSEELILPHPRFRDRLFVLAPLNDIAGNLVVPQFNMTVGELLNNIRTNESIKRTEINLFY